MDGFSVKDSSAIYFCQFKQCVYKKFHFLELFPYIWKDKHCCLAFKYVNYYSSFKQSDSLPV